METFKKYLLWATVGLFAYMPFHIFISQYFSTYTGGLDAWKVAKDVFAAALVAVLVCIVLLKRLYTRPYLYFLGFAVVYLALHLVSWFATGQPNDTGLLATVYNNRLVWYLLIGFSIALLLPGKRVHVQFAKILLVVSTVVCVVGLAQWILPKDIMTNFGYSIERGVKPNFFIDDKTDFPRVFSTIRDPNSLGAFLLLPLTLGLLYLQRYWKTDRRMLFVGIVGLHLLIILLTFSRGAWIATFLLLFASAVVLLRQHLSRYWKQYGAVLGVFLIVALAGLYQMRNSYFVQNTILHADQSTTQADPNELRLQFYEKSIDGIVDDPEGNGPGTAGLVSTRLPGGGLLTENYYLQIAYEVGVTGLLLFLAFWGYVIKLLWARRSDIVAKGLLISCVGLAFVNLLIHGWSNEALAVGWFLLAGLVIGRPK